MYTYYIYNRIYSTIIHYNILYVPIARHGSNFTGGKVAIERPTR